MLRITAVENLKEAWWRSVSYVIKLMSRILGKILLWVKAIIAAAPAAPARAEAIAGWRASPA